MYAVLKKAFISGLIGSIYQIWSSYAEAMSVFEGISNKQS